MSKLDRVQESLDKAQEWLDQYTLKEIHDMDFYDMPDYVTSYAADSSKEERANDPKIAAIDIKGMAMALASKKPEKDNKPVVAASGLASGK